MEISIENIILFIIMIFLGALNIYEKKQAEYREKDLLNRLMSKDFAEYTIGTRRLTTKPVESAVLDKIADTLKAEEIEERDRYPVT